MKNIKRWILTAGILCCLLIGMRTVSSAADIWNEMILVYGEEGEKEYIGLQQIGTSEDYKVLVANELADGYLSLWVSDINKTANKFEGTIKRYAYPSAFYQTVSNSHISITIVQNKYADVCVVFQGESTETLRYEIQSPVMQQPVLTLSNNSKKLYLNEAKTFILSLNKKNITETVKWYSSDESIAVVNQSGKVTAKKAGTVYIYASANGVTVKCTVTIKTTNASLKLSKTKNTLYLKGGNKTCTLGLTKKNITQKVKWTSSNKKIAVVNQKGKVTAKKTGKVTIKARANGITVSCTITVKAKKETTKDKALKAYKKELQKTSIKTKSYTVSLKKSEFTLAYIDTDNIPELIIKERGANGAGVIYSYRNGKAVLLQEVGGNQFYYCKKKGVFYTVSKSKYDAFRWYYTLSGNRCNVKAGKAYNFLGGTMYYKDAWVEEISKKEYDQTVKNLMRGKKEVLLKFYKNTSQNQKKYLK